MIIKYNGCIDDEKKFPKFCQNCELRWKFSECVKYQKATGRDVATIRG